MASIREIKGRIAGIKDTEKITNAMYLISSTKLSRAKNELDRTRPYFRALQGEIKRIFRTAPDIDSPYFYPASGEKPLNGTYGCLVITADKGLAGAYNHNVLKRAEAMCRDHPDTKLFVVGEFGRHYFAQRNIPIEKSFLYPAMNPTIQRAREICTNLLERYDAKELEKIYIIYTDMKNSMTAEPMETRLLPFHRGRFAGPGSEGDGVRFEFTPNLEVILNNVIPSYVTGFVYSALVDSFCSEQDSRMIAMDAAGENAQEMLEMLSVQYHHVRQAQITKEITEIASGARAQRKKRDRG